MKAKTLGVSGLRVSALGLGCINFGMMCDQRATDSVVHKALDLGITFFDVANNYGGPHGRAENMLSKSLGNRRSDIVIGTKFGGASGRGGGSLLGGGSRNFILAAVEASLLALATDYIDLYQLHFPDFETPIDETLRTLDDLIRQGKVRYIGCSNYPAWMLVQAQWTAKEIGTNAFISVQNRYSLVKREVEAEVVPAANTHGVGILPYFPLESGLLTGKVKRGEEPPNGSRLSMWKGAFIKDHKFDVIDKLQDLGNETGHKLLDYAIGWLIAQPHVGSVIAGATSPDQVVQNFAAAEASLTIEELNKVSEITSI